MPEDGWATNRGRIGDGRIALPPQVIRRLAPMAAIKKARPRRPRDNQFVECPIKSRRLNGLTILTSLRVGLLRLLDDQVKPFGVVDRHFAEHFAIQVDVRSL